MKSNPGSKIDPSFHFGGIFVVKQYKNDDKMIVNQCVVNQVRIAVKLKGLGNREWGKAWLLSLGY